MKGIAALILLGLCGFFGYQLWLSNPENETSTFKLNSAELENYNEVILWKPLSSAVNLSEIPYWNDLAEGTKAAGLLNDLNAELSQLELNNNLTLTIYLGKGSSVFHFNSEVNSLTKIISAFLGLPQIEEGKLLSGEEKFAFLSGSNALLAFTQESITSLLAEEKEKTIATQKLESKTTSDLTWMTKSSVGKWFSRDEIPVSGAATVEFKKRNGFIYAYTLTQDSLAQDESLGVTYSLWDFQVPGQVNSFTIEDFPIRALDAEVLEEVEVICECDIPSAWKSWNTQHLYLFSQNGIEFFGIQSLENLTLETGLYPFIDDKDQMYKGYQIQSLISGGEVGALYADMFGREVSHFIDLEEQAFFFSSLSDAKTFINGLQSQSFGLLVDKQIQELLLLSPDYTEYNINATGNDPLVYQYEKQNKAEYFHALWRASEDAKEIEPVNVANVISSAPQNKWEKQLSGKVVKKPFIFTNHYTKEKEVALVTADNLLTLLDSKGKVLWTRQMDEPIMGELHQVDLFRNNKFQLVFSGKSKLYAVDRNGKNVENFPVTLSSSASAPVSVMDYDGKRKYRLLVPLTDGSLVNYNGDGKEVNGWKHKAEESPIISEVLHTVIKRRDYLVCAKEDGKLAIYKRDGKLRYTQDLKLSNYDGKPIKMVSASQIEEAKLLYEDNAGNLVQVMLSLDDNSAEILGMAGGDYTLMKDVVNDKQLDYLISRGKRLSLFDEDYELKFTKDFESTINSALQVFKTSSSRFIGVSSGTGLYLLEPNGEVLNGFPLYGQGSFSIADLDKDGKYELIGSDAQGLVVCYTLGL